MKKKRTSPLEGTLAAVVVLAVALVAGFRAFEGDGAFPIPSGIAAAEAHPAFLYGRVTDVDGVTHEGRLCWGDGEEAFWTDLFDGAKTGNPWVGHAPPERLTERRPIEVFGIELGSRERRVDVGRPFMARFGDLARIDTRGRDVRVTLKSGTVFVLDRYEAGDIDDGVRVWDERRGVVDLGTRRIRTIELLACDRRGAAPHRLHGTVRTNRGDFTGFVRWGRRARVASDTLHGRTEDGVRAVDLRFETVRSVARRSRESCSVTLVDGGELVLCEDGDVGPVRRIHVDDPRHGRVRISWDAFERVDFGPAPDDGGPAYADFPAGRPLTGSVTTRAGRRLAGRLVFDLDESETTETLDAPSGGVHYSVPFGRIASITPRVREAGATDARVTLHDGDDLCLERDGDLGDGNAGLLVFVDGEASPTYVAWADVERIDLERPR